MTIIRCTDCETDNARMTDAGYDVIAAETFHWDDGHTETEILWAKDEQPITDSEVPF